MVASWVVAGMVVAGSEGVADLGFEGDVGLGFEVVDSGW